MKILGSPPVKYSPRVPSSASQGGTSQGGVLIEHRPTAPAPGLRLSTPTFASVSAAGALAHVTGHWHPPPTTRRRPIIRVFGGYQCAPRAHVGGIFRPTSVHNASGKAAAPSDTGRALNSHVVWLSRAVTGSRPAPREKVLKGQAGRAWRAASLRGRKVRAALG
jgi:hypothetical protein